MCIEDLPHSKLLELESEGGPIRFAGQRSGWGGWQKRAQTPFAFPA